MVQQIKTLLLLGAMTAFGVGFASWFAPSYGLVFLGIALAMNVGAYFFSDRLVLASQGARELPVEEAPILHAEVEELAARAGIPKPRVALVDDWSPNAFAAGRGPGHATVAVTRGLLGILDQRELRGVLAHEIAHVKNRDVLVATIASCLAAVVTHAAQLAAFASWTGSRDDEEDGVGSSGTSLLLVLVAPLAATAVQLGISRSREFLADETAARLTGDPEGLASALESLEQGVATVDAEAEREGVDREVPLATASLQIVNPIARAGSWLAGLFSTHPPIDERVRRLLALVPHARAPRGSETRSPASGVGA